jgi:predicted nucleotidyltransferase
VNPSYEAVRADRRAVSEERYLSLREWLAKNETDPGSACVYATGSVARREATEHSDLDLFIVDTADESNGELPLTTIQSTLLKADLIRGSREVGFPPFSGDGAYLQVHMLTDIVGNTGMPVDDWANSFTARVLLMLESRPLLNDSAHVLAASQVINSYWRDYDENVGSFRPVFLVNDIMRYWKTVCLNYEADRNQGAPTGYDALRWRNRNKLKNVKLKFSRLLICHSALAYLLWKSRDGRSVTPEDAREMFELSPIERMVTISGDSELEGLVANVVELYSWFLTNVPGSRDEALAWVGDREQWAEARSHGETFGHAVGGLLAALGSESHLYRFLIV